MPGVPVDVAQGGTLIEELKYGNHPGVKDHAEVITKKVVPNVVTGRALGINAIFVQEIQGIRLSPLSVVEEPSLRNIHDLIFTESGNRSSVNEVSDFDCAPPCELAACCTMFLLRVLYFRLKTWARRPHRVVSH